VIAIKNTWQTWDATRRTDKDDMGRVLHITSTCPTHALGITGSAQDSPPEQEARPCHASPSRRAGPKPPRREDGSASARRRRNAVLATTDRASGAGYPQDAAHGVRSEGRRPQSRRAQSCTPPTFRPVFEDGERHTSSRIDDIMLCGVHSGVSARQRRRHCHALGPRAADCAHRHNGNRPVYPQPQGRAQHGKPTRY
jgi:hypothetical protein